MKALKKWFKIIALFFTALILLQGCVAYQNTSVSLEQAVQEQKPAKVNTIPNETYYFNQIGFEDGQFYGLKKVKGETVKIPIDNNEVYKVFLHSKSKSTWTTIAIIAVPVITLAILAATWDYGPGLNYGS
jgi:PBP1b-binding outer membrane lipoprotein LpoB